MSKPDHVHASHRAVLVLAKNAAIGAGLAPLLITGQADSEPVPVHRGGDGPVDCIIVGYLTNEPGCRLGGSYPEWPGVAAAGRVKPNTLPPWGRGIANSRPPCRSRIDRQIDSPIPIPDALVL